mmetsp:Transcript_6215/g.12848  ORF Transcript_6215/g.12848 Transcript_6215/m.12848 type:complete len:177 (+) Transcript_6215:90-620(+)
MKRMKSISSFASALLVLLHILVLVNADGGQKPSNEDVQMECLATSTDMDSFRCISSGSMRIACIDEDKRCPEWSRNGECKTNPQYMLVSCRKSCSSCIPLHPGEEPQIAYDNSRAKVLGRLYETQEYLHKEAIRNVETLKYCRNKHSECTHWWSIGECKKNPQFMTTECAPACQTC